MRSLVSEAKKAVEEAVGSRVYDLTMGFREIMASLLCNTARIWGFEMCEGIGVVVKVSVDALRTAVVN